MVDGSAAPAETAAPTTGAASTAPTTATTQPASPAGETLLTGAATDAPGQGAGEAATAAPEGGAGDPAPAAEAISYDGLKLPEGLEVHAETLDAAKAIFGELKIPADKAQKLVDLHGKLQAAQAEAWSQTVQSWAAEAKADPFLSGKQILEGGFTSFQEAQTAAARFMARFGTPELRQALDSMGLGNHPELFKAVAKAGRELAQDQVLTGAAGTAGNPLRARYPNSPQLFGEA